MLCIVLVGILIFIKDKYKTKRVVLTHYMFSRNKARQSVFGVIIYLTYIYNIGEREL